MNASGFLVAGGTGSLGSRVVEYRLCSPSCLRMWLLGDSVACTKGFSETG
jgi:hypothetical protein